MKKKITLLLIFSIILILCTIIFAIYFSGNDPDNYSVTIEEINESTTILISQNSNKIYQYLYFLIAITVNWTLATLFFIIEYLKNKKINTIFGIIIIIIVNTIITLLLFPTLIIVPLLLGISIFIIYIIRKYILRK